MTRFIPFSRDQAFLLPPDAKDWLPEHDVADFVVAAVERVPLGAFAVRPIPGGRAQYHPRLLLALLIYSYANGIFSSRRIERATHRDIGVRYVAANLHPDHDTIAAFRRANRAAFEAAFLQVLLLAEESGLLRLGTVAIDGTTLDANASRIRSVRCDRAKALRAKLAAEIAGMTAQAEAADAEGQPDPQALPAEIARREALEARLDAACARLEEQARAAAEAARPDYAAKQAAYDAKTGRRGRPPKPPAQAARGRPATDPPVQPHRSRQRADAPLRRARIPPGLQCPGRGLRRGLAVDPGHRRRRNAGRCAELRRHHPWHAAGHRPAQHRPRRHRLRLRRGGRRPRGPQDRAAGRHRPHPAAPALRFPAPTTAQGTTPHQRTLAPRHAGQAADQGCQTLYARRKQTVEPVFGIIKAALGFTRCHRRGLANVQAEWSLIALA